MDNISLDVANIIEKELIKKYNTQNSEYGYNIKGGGEEVDRGLYGIRYYCSKKVYQYDINGNYIKEWNNVHEASINLNISEVSIYRSCRSIEHKFKAGNYMWSYIKYNKIKPYIKYSRHESANLAILQIDFDFNIIKEYECISFIDEKKYNKFGVTKCCKRKSVSHKGYYWCYKKDYEEELFKKYILEKLKTIKNKTKIIYQCDLCGNIINKFYPNEIENLTKFNINTVKSWCNHNNVKLNHGMKSGFLWIYKEDYDIIGIQNIINTIKEKK